MAETMTLQQRIAMLNMQHVRAPNVPDARNNTDRPPPPPRPASTEASLDVVSQNPIIENQPAAAAPEGKIRPEPKRLPLPPPRPKAAPALPPRSPSGQSLPRRDSSESILSTISDRSVASATSSRLTPSTSATSRRPSAEARGSSDRIKAPAYDPSSLPPLPPKKSETQQRPSIGLRQKTVGSYTPPSLPSRPTLVGRQPSISAQQESARNHSPPTPSLPPRKPTEPSTTTPSVPRRPNPASEDTAPPKPPRRSALDFGLNKSTSTAPRIPQRPGTDVPTTNETQPPPIPRASRPNLSALQASKPKFSAETNSYSTNAASCLKCRDFSGPDQHAARFPRTSIPSHDLKWLSSQLTSPFPSATDKARAVFTWLHHNIAYNAKDFFSGNVKGCTPADTMTTGLAVCAGYADLFSALCMNAGLECIVISGNGKGYGHQAVKRGDPIPPFSCGHAWNAVKIDHDEWKLVDSCWGAGYIDGETQQYTKKFNPAEFVMSNEEFGLKHFPEKPAHFFRSDARVISWEEYLLGSDGDGEEVTPCPRTFDEYGLSPSSFQPRKKVIKVRGAPPTQRMHFQFGSVCEHWDHMAKGTGPPRCFILQIGGRDGREPQRIPFNSDAKGRHWWADVPVQDLGCPGQTVFVNAILTVDGKDAKGLTPEGFKAIDGRKGMSWSGCVAYQLV